MPIDALATDIVHELLEVPSHERDVRWLKVFYEKLPHAGFKLAKENVIAGPDGFPYLNLQVPDESESFEAHYVSAHLERLLARGCGVVFNSHRKGYVFGMTFGSFWCFKEFGFFAQPEGKSNEKLSRESSLLNSVSTVLNNEDSSIFYGNPTEKTLPNYVRQFLNSYLVRNYKLEEVGIIWLADPNNDPNESLIFSFTEAAFSGDEAYERCMNGLRWHLPDFYVVGTFSEKTKKDFRFFTLWPSEGA